MDREQMRFELAKAALEGVARDWTHVQSDNLVNMMDANAKHVVAWADSVLAALDAGTPAPQKQDQQPQPQPVNELVSQALRECITCLRDEGYALHDTPVMLANRAMDALTAAPQPQPVDERLVEALKQIMEMAGSHTVPAGGDGPAGFEAIYQLAESTLYDAARQQQGEANVEADSEPVPTWDAIAIAVRSAYWCGRADMGFGVSPSRLTVIVDQVRRELYDKKPSPTGGAK